jgi:microcystin degradation protein MlrC
MRTAANAIITFKEYPHDDIGARAAELYRLSLRTARGEAWPVMAYYDCRMINMWRTSLQPMRDFVERMQALEGRDGILSVSFSHGFPWGDVEDVGAKVLVIADGDLPKAEALARRLVQELWEMRERTATQHDTVDGAIDFGLAHSNGPVVLADVADNAGGGAPSDNTVILRRLAERGVKNAAIGCFWDPQAVRFCFEAGEGASLPLRIGGKCGPASGDPVDLRVTVRELLKDHTQHGLSGGRASFGPSAWVSADGIDIVLVSSRQQTFAPDAFTGLGITLDDKRIVVVKSTQHFHAAFAPIASRIRYVAAAGAIPPEFDKTHYTERTQPYWPRVSDQFRLTNPP